MDVPRAPHDAEAPLPGTDDPLIPPPAAAADDDHGAPRRRWRTVPWPTVLGLLFLTINSGAAIRRSRGEPGAVAFVAFSYVDLILLFACLRWYEAAEPESVARGWLRAAVWALTTALTVVFSAKVAAAMPAAVAVTVWILAFATVAGGFYGFFIHTEKA